VLEAVRFAMLARRFQVMQLGAQPSAPNRAQFQRFLIEQKKQRRASKHR